MDTLSVRLTYTSSMDTKWHERGVCVGVGRFQVCRFGIFTQRLLWNLLTGAPRHVGNRRTRNRFNTKKKKGTDEFSREELTFHKYKYSEEELVSNGQTSGWSELNGRSDWSGRQNLDGDFVLKKTEWVGLYPLVTIDISVKGSTSHSDGASQTVDCNLVYSGKVEH